MSYSKQIAELFEKGLDAEDICGYHGTSTEAVQKLAETGKLPNGGRHPGQLYVVPMSEKKVFTPREAAESYADWNAKKHYILPHLPFAPTTQDIESLAEYCSMNMGGKMREIDYKVHDRKGEIRGLIAKCEKNGLSEDALVKLRKEAKNHKGVIIALSASLSKNFEIKTQEGVPDEFYIEVPEGLPIGYIYGIEPVGQHEWDVLQKMQRELK